MVSTSDLLYLSQFVCIFLIIWQVSGIMDSLELYSFLIEMGSDKIQIFQFYENSFSESMQ